MKQKDKLTISIGTTAFNEEQNIKRFLDSVCSQTQDSIRIREIIVISDGSTDRTAEIVGNVEDSRIKLRVGKKRLGMTARHNQLLKLFAGDVLVVFDADVILKDNRVVERLVSKFKEDKRVGLVGGNAQPLPAQTFIEAAANNFLLAREGLKKTYDFKGSALAVRGPIMAFSRKFAKRLSFPPNLMASDGFSYLTCKTEGFKFHHEESAIVWFRSPQTIKDYMAQATRFIAGKPQLYEYFDKALVDKEYQVPRTVQIKIMLVQLMRNPLGYIVLKVLFMYALWQSPSYLKKLDTRWVQIGSSKKLIMTSESKK